MTAVALPGSVATARSPWPGRPARARRRGDGGAADRGDGVARPARRGGQPGAHGGRRGRARRGGGRPTGGGAPRGRRHDATLTSYTAAGPPDDGWWSPSPFATGAPRQPRPRATAGPCRRRSGPARIRRMRLPTLDVVAAGDHRDDASRCHCRARNRDRRPARPQRQRPRRPKRGLCPPRRRATWTTRPIACRSSPATISPHSGAPPRRRRRPTWSR